MSFKPSLFKNNVSGPSFVSNGKAALLLATMLAASLSSTIALAGEGSVGNGGNAVVCKDSSGKITSVELLDYYEARTELGFTIDLGAPDLDPIAKAQIAIKRLSVSNPQLGRWLTYAVSQFVASEADFIPNASLTPVQDSNQIAVPSGCSVVQLAIQKPVSLPEQKRYTVNKDLWDLLDNDNKAGLILHEIIYTEALSAGATDSVGVRYFNGLISSHQIEKTEPYTLLEVERQVPLQFFEYGGHRFKITTLNNIPYPYFSAHSGEFEGGPTAPGEWVTVDGKGAGVKSIIYDDGGAFPQQVELSEPVDFDFHGFPLQFTDELTLDKNGKIRRGRVSPQSYFDFESSDYSLKSVPGIPAPSFPSFPSFVAENEAGDIVECGNCAGWVKVLGQQMTVNRSGNATDEAYDFFNPDTFASFGNRTLHLADPTPFNVAGTTVTIRGQATFYDLGGGKLSLESGKLVSPGAFRAGSQTMTLQWDFTLFQDGNLMTGTLNQPATLTDVAGNTQTYPKITKVTFNRLGQLEDAQVQ